MPERLRRGGIYEYACKENGEPGYGPIEAEFLFAFITAKRPNRIVQVGCGVSTAVILLAARDANYTPQVICVDPFPTGYLTRTAGNKLIQLIQKPAQEVDLTVLTTVNAGDLLWPFGKRRVGGRLPPPTPTIPPESATVPGVICASAQIAGRFVAGRPYFQLRLGDHVSPPCPIGHYDRRYQLRPSRVMQASRKLTLEQTRRLLSRKMETILIEEFLAENTQPLLRKALKLAQQGNVALLRLFLDRILPRPKEALVNIGPLSVDTTEELLEAQAKVMQELGSGQLTPSHSGDYRRF
jgi:hypothetical protein